MSKEIHIGGGAGQLFNENGRLVAVASQQEDAEQIVLRWNAHDELLASLEKMVQAARDDGWSDDGDGPLLHDANALIRRLRGPKP